tara:strand:+ start:187 stop:705 length:519 start_codon:yes stop_codon:yes gene_type:complete
MEGSISNRNGHLVIGRHAVPVREVTNSICDRMDIEWLTQRYPLQEGEIMDCMDAIADIDTLNGGGHLTLRNTAEQIGEMVLETKTISDVYFLKTIQYGKVFLEQEKDFNTLYDKGFRMLAIESFEDELNNSVTFESSDLHIITYNAIMDITADGFDKQLFVQFMKEEDESKV